MDAWFENESFWPEGYRFMFSDDAFRAASAQVEQILALTGISGGRVLDLGCGPGRHAVPLALKAVRGFGRSFIRAECEATNRGGTKGVISPTAASVKIACPLPW